MDCGLFAISFAIETITGAHRYVGNDQWEMRQHLARCLLSKQIKPFPRSQKEKFQQCVKGGWKTIELICICKRPSLYARTITCAVCNNIYHRQCLGINDSFDIPSPFICKIKSVCHSN